jgi:hypothetical protein
MGGGFVVTADYGNPEEGRSIGLGAGASRGRFGGDLEFAHRDFGQDDGLSFGGTLGLMLFGRGPVQVGAQLGFSTIDRDTGNETAVLPGASARVGITAVPLKPWGVLTYRIGDNLPDEFRFTLGADWSFLPSLGAHASYEWGDSANLWGVGAHFRFEIPALGLVFPL